jgi:hypothetical protein
MDVVPRKDKGFLPLGGLAGRPSRRRRRGGAAGEGLDNATALLRLDSRRFILRADAARFTRHTGREPSTIPFAAAAWGMEITPV